MQTGGYTHREAIPKQIESNVSPKLPPSSVSPAPNAAETLEEKQQQQLEEEEEEKDEKEEVVVEADEEEEEQERVAALLQRKKLLQDLGLVDQIHQLLQGLTGGGGVPQEACNQQSRPAHQRRQTKVRADDR